MLDFNLISLIETNRILLRIADALDRAYPPPAKAAERKPRPMQDLMVTDDFHLAELEEEEERKRMLMEEEG